MLEDQALDIVAHTKDRLAKREVGSAWAPNKTPGLHAGASPRTSTWSASILAAGMWRNRCRVPPYTGSASSVHCCGASLHPFLD
jgi:hypothetical protein